MLNKRWNFVISLSLSQLQSINNSDRIPIQSQPILSVFVIILIAIKTHETPPRKPQWARDDSLFSKKQNAVNNQAILFGVRELSLYSTSRGINAVSKQTIEKKLQLQKTIIVRKQRWFFQRKPPYECGAKQFVSPAAQAANERVVCMSSRRRAKGC
jgi:hypothetical protein